MDLTISLLTQIFTNRAKIHSKIVVANDLTESIRGGTPCNKSHRFCANLTRSPRVSRQLGGSNPPNPRGLATVNKTVVLKVLTLLSYSVYSVISIHLYTAFHM